MEMHTPLHPPPQYIFLGRRNMKMNTEMALNHGSHLSIKHYHRGPDSKPIDIIAKLHIYFKAMQSPYE